MRGLLLYLVLTISLVLAIGKLQDQHIHGVTVPDWYDSKCCSSNDCRAVSPDEVIELPDGSYRYKEFTFRKDQALPSKDKDVHVCIAGKIPRCVYVQQGS